VPSWHFERSSARACSPPLTYQLAAPTPRRDEGSPVKLIDFSLATFFHTPADPGGTPDFVAPELLNNSEQMAKVGCAAPALASESGSGAAASGSPRSAFIETRCRARLCIAGYRMLMCLVCTARCPPGWLRCRGGHVGSGGDALLPAQRPGEPPSPLSRLLEADLWVPQPCPHRTLVTAEGR
jgi:hypothetical protein